MGSNMTDVLFEQRVVQNPGLGAETIWHAIHEAYELNGKTEGVPILLAFIIRELKLISSRFQHNNKRKVLCLPDFPSCHWLKHLP